MTSALDTRDRELLEHLHKSGGADVQQLCDVLGVTRTAIRQRLTRLENLEFIAAHLQSQSRGRPRNVYCVTADGLHSLGEDYRELAVVLWEAIVSTEQPEIRERLISQVRDRLAGRFRRLIGESGSVTEKLDRVADQLKSSGFKVESDHSEALPILRETNCPFPMLADVDEAICQVEREALEQVLGAPVAFKNRCRDGHHCCEFEVRTGTTGGSLPTTS
jgi:predicted ArsR family transcriptional regulator